MLKNFIVKGSMRKFIFLLICCLSCSNYLIANETDDLLQLFHLAVENKNLDLVKDVIEALLKSENSSKHLLEALAKYSEQGKVDFALHNAIKDKNLLASVILAYHAKNLNTRKPGSEVIWTSIQGKSKGGVSRINKTLLELSLESNMVEIVPYLLMKGANPHVFSDINFLYEGEEDPNYMKELGFEVRNITGMDPKIPIIIFFKTNCNANYKRSFIGEVIAKNRLDIIEILNNLNVNDWNFICCKVNGTDYTPLQFSLAIKRYEIAQFLINHGARIE